MLYQRRFAGAGHAYNGNAAAALDFQADVVERGFLQRPGIFRLVGMGEMARNDDGVFHSSNSCAMASTVSASGEMLKPAFRSRAANVRGSGIASINDRSRSRSANTCGGAPSITIFP